VLALYINDLIYAFMIVLQLQHGCVADQLPQMTEFVPARGSRFCRSHTHLIFTKIEGDYYYFQ
jgi:hypothetical protein